MECVEKIYLDDVTGDYVATKYFINGIEVDEEEYCEYLDADIVEDGEDEEYECDGNCDVCEATCEDVDDDLDEECPICNAVNFIDSLYDSCLTDQEISMELHDYIETLMDDQYELGKKHLAMNVADRMMDILEDIE